MDLGLILGPIVLVVILNVCVDSDFVQKCLFSGRPYCTEHVSYSSMIILLRVTRTLGTLGMPLCYSSSAFLIVWNRVLVHWILLLDTVHTACTIYMLWDFTIPNFGNYDVFTNVPWPFPTTPIFSSYYHILF